MSREKNIELEQAQEAFLGYIGNMRPSTGQKFISHLVRDSGVKAFEDFWKNLCEAREQWPHKLALQPHEEKALAKALYANSRRDFLRGVASATMCGAAGWLGRDGAREYVNHKQQDGDMKALKAVGKLMAAAGVGFSGLAVLSTDVPSEKTIEEITKGPEGEARVRRMVASLDTIFEPVTLAMTETGMGRG